MNPLTNDDNREVLIQMTLTLSVRNFSQYEMVVTQWAFVGPALLWPDKLGISLTSPESEEVRHRRLCRFS